MRRALPRGAAFVFLGLLTQGFLCAQPTPTQRAWNPYVSAVQPILNDHDDAMNFVATIDIKLTPAADVSGKMVQAINPAGAVVELERDVIPKLIATAALAARIQTPNSPRLTSFHKPLVDGLTLKADAYKMMVEGFKRKDPAIFDKGAEKLVAASAQLSGYRSEFNAAVIAGGVRE